MKTKKKVVIIGAGPAGLAAAYELLKQAGDKYEVTVLEKTKYIGGISRTVYCDGNNMDIGGHRFHMRIPLVGKWWEEILPAQGSLACDDKELGRKVRIKKGGPNPEKVDDVLLFRKRISRILFKKKFFDYPVSLSYATVKNMGFGTTMVAGVSLIKSKIVRRPEESLEDYYVNQFGRKLYSMFFEKYTENLWGRHPKNISPDYGSERVNDKVSIFEMLKNVLSKKAREAVKEEKEKDIFAYPKLGPGQMWEKVAAKIIDMGGKIVVEADVVGIQKNKKERIEKVRIDQNGKIRALECDYLISSMPIKDLAVAMDNMPEKIRKIALGLPYRDYIMVGVVCRNFNLKNDTKSKTGGNIIPDEWVYVHDKNVKMGRLQVFNNWSPYLAKDNKNTVWVGLEYFCNEGDEMWNASDEELEAMAVDEMVKMEMIDNKKDAIKEYVVRVEKAYPAYFDTYAQIGDLKDYLNKIENLYCVGRNGRHCYSDLDYSICSSFESVKNIISGSKDKMNIWDSQYLPEYKEVKNNKERD